MYPRLRRYGRLGETYIKAGWKVVVDNYVECYHCDHAHPAFADIICMDTYKHDTYDHWARQLGSDIKEENSAYPVDKDAQYKNSAFWFLWPNTTFNILPGAAEFNVSVIRPINHLECSFEGHSLTVNNDFDAGRAEYTANVLVPEDISLCESVQRGLMQQQQRARTGGQITLRWPHRWRPRISCRAQRRRMLGLLC